MESTGRLARIARERLHPSLREPSFLVLRRRRRLFTRWLEAVPGDSLRVLDVGGRVQPYRRLLESRLARYVAVDLVPTPLIDVVAVAERLPFGPAAFDLVLCTQVLEYVAHPARAVREMYRVLRPGAVLLLSAPAVFPRDGEHDGWRFLPPALRALTSRFTEVHIEPEGLTVAGICRTANVALDLLARPRVVRAALRWTAYPMINLTGLVLDGLSGANDRFAVNYSVFARK